MSREYLKRQRKIAKHGLFKYLYLHCNALPKRLGGRGTIAVLKGPQNVDDIDAVGLLEMAAARDSQKAWA